MRRRECQRCRRRNVESARFCGTCGRPMPARSPNGALARSGVDRWKGASAGAWVAFCLLAVAIIDGRPVDRIRSAGRSPQHARTTGLIMDLPPDYPSSFFMRHAIPTHGLPARNDIG